MLKTANAIQTRLDSLVFVIGYYLLTGVVFLLTAVSLLLSAISAIWHMATSHSFYADRAVLMVSAVIATSLIGAWMVNCAFGLWSNDPKSRPSTIVLSSLLTIISLLAIPVLKLVYIDSASFIMPLAAVIAVCSALATWYLLRPEVMHYYENAD